MKMTRKKKLQRPPASPVRVTDTYISHHPQPLPPREHQSTISHPHQHHLTPITKVEPGGSHGESISSFPLCFTNLESWRRMTRVIVVDVVRDGGNCSYCGYVRKTLLLLTSHSLLYTSHGLSEVRGIFVFLCDIESKGGVREAIEGA
ncbi:hypothetical protein L1049_017896 [Liquidambar formosana]|uniref:Uncharacterized protein n=1 Tax=Liquidambar formosana TaxID=63359 RepID=A0AAP0R8T7_LIQFO